MEIVSAWKHELELISEQNSFQQYFSFLKKLLLNRVSLYLQIDNSKTFDLINKYLIDIDNLTIFLIHKEIIPFLNLIQPYFNNSSEISRCIVSRPNENKQLIKEYRNIVQNCWDKILNKAKELTLVIVNENKKK